MRSTTVAATSSRPSTALCLSGILALSLPRIARAEDSIDYKFENYQEENGRMHITAHYVRAEKQIGDATRISVQGVIDTITGATPTGQAPAPGSDQVPLTEMHDVRRGENLEVAHSFGAHEVSIQLSYSKESDYVSRGVALTDLINFNQKNTILQIGYAHNADLNQAHFFAIPRSKSVDDGIIGVSQVLDPRTTLAVDLSIGRDRGYQGDPYRVYQIDIVPGIPLPYEENRPHSRTKLTLFTRCTHFFDAAHGSIDATARFYHDTWGINSTTLELSWLQKLGTHLVLIPSYRWYAQSAASFYHPTLDGTGIDPTEFGTGLAPFYAVDYRLSKLQATTAGLKLVANLSAHLHADVSFQHYVMRGRDGITPQSSFPTANITSVGLGWTF